MSFIQKATLVVLQYIIPSVLALVAALMASGAKDSSDSAKEISIEIENRLIAIQARLDERDLVAHEGYENTLLIPVGNDQMWTDYYHLTTVKGLSRKEAAKQILKSRAITPHKSISIPAWNK